MQQCFMYAFEAINWLASATWRQWLSNLTMQKPLAILAGAISGHVLTLWGLAS